MAFEDTMRIAARYADGKIVVGRIDKVAVLMFNQPAKRNAVSLEMWDGVCDALDLLAADNEVRVVVYAGAGGKAFSSGNDISQFATRRDNPETRAEFARITGRGGDKLANLQKPSIACIQGYCMGGGLGIALRADLRVAAADAVFGIPAARLGIAYGIDPMERLMALVGPARARLILYTAGKFTAPQALAMGLVEVIATEDAARETLDLATSIAENAPLSVQAAKYVVDQVLLEPARRDVEAVADRVRRCLESADHREGRAAFMEKRKPVFNGE